MELRMPMDEPQTQPDKAGAAVELRGVTKYHASRSGQVHAVDDVSLTVPHGQFVSLLGPSGCGKSSLLSVIGGLSTASAGSVQVHGAEARGPQTQAGFVFQAPTLLRWRSALENILLQAEAKKLDRGAARRRAAALLESVGLGDFQDKLPGELSGGMQQRVAMCRALLHDPELILMDEPFGALDALTRDEMNLLLQQLWLDMSRTIIFVTHSIAEAVFLSDRVLVMSRRPGRIVLDLQIELPRPRSLDIQEESGFADYMQQLRAAL